MGEHETSRVAEGEAEANLATFFSGQFANVIEGKGEVAPELDGIGEEIRDAITDIASRIAQDSLIAVASRLRSNS